MADAEEEAPGCQSTFTDRFGYQWHCQSKWGHYGRDHSALIPVAFRLEIPPMYSFTGSASQVIWTTEQADPWFRD